MNMEEEDEYIASSWTQLTLCGEPTIYEGLRFAKDLIIANLILRWVIQSFKIPHNVRHSLSLVIGTFLLYNNIESAVIWPVGLTVCSYILIVVVSLITKKHRGLLISSFIIMFLLLCELYVMNPKMWHQIRGIQMVAAMKIISVAFDLDRNLFKNILNPIEYGGYVLCSANNILGPWISFQVYNQYMEQKFLSKRWIKLLILNLLLSLLFLILSNCIVPWYIDDSSFKWLVAYRDAQAFRMSHFFVSSMSIVTMLSAGFGLSSDCHSDLHVTKPLYIELPRSLVQVVIYWNMPMHQWLKTYVFKSCQPYGKFIAIFITYVVSSLLHGLNFQLSAVLLSIGTFSYVEYNFRFKVATAFKVCCLANPCGKQCDHIYKKNSYIAMLLNTLFSVMTLIHLAYLGVMFEASFAVQESGYSYYHTLTKWENLNYLSHYLIAFLFLIYSVM